MMVTLLGLLLMACQHDVQLVTHLNQSDALEIVTQLDHYGIDATLTETTGRETWSIMVAPHALSSARRVLQHHHLPPPSPSVSGSGDTLWSSPQTRRQELDRERSDALRRTLQRIPGVLDARVHMASPPQVRPAWRQTDSRGDGEGSWGRVAVLLLIHDTPEEVEVEVATVQALVAHALPRVREGDVLVQQERVPPLVLETTSPWVMLGPWRVMAEDAMSLRLVLALGALLMLILAAMLVRMVGLRRATEPTKP